MTLPNKVGCAHHPYGKRLARFGLDVSDNVEFVTERVKFLLGRLHVCSFDMIPVKLKVSISPAGGRSRVSK